MLGSSFNQRATKNQELSYEKHKLSINHFKTLEKGISSLSKKITVHANNEFLSPTKTIVKKDPQTSRNKIRKQLKDLNTDCFYKANRLFYTNKPIINFDFPLFKTQSITDSLEHHSPIKKPFCNKSSLSEIINSNKVKLYELTNHKNQYIYTEELKKLENDIKKLTPKELRKQKEIEDFNKFKNFNRETKLLS